VKEKRFHSRADIAARMFVLIDDDDDAPEASSCPIPKGQKVFFDDAASESSAIRSFLLVQRGWIL